MNYATSIPPINFVAGLNAIGDNIYNGLQRERLKSAFANFNGSNFGEIAKSLNNAGDTEDALKFAIAGIKSGPNWTANPVTGELYDKNAASQPQQTQTDVPQTNGPQPGDSDVALLQAHPDMADAFDQKFGKGASQKILAPAANMTAPANPIEAKTFHQQRGKLLAGAGKAQDAMNVVNSSLDRMKEQALALKNDPGLGDVTGAYKILGHETPIPNYLLYNQPGHPAAHAQAQFDTLKSQITQNVLAQFRAQSATGGALGQVSNYEDKLLQANLAALDQAQSKEDVQKALDKIIKFADDAKIMHQRAFEAQFGGQ